MCRYKPSEAQARERGFVQPLAEYLQADDVQAWMKRHRMDSMELPSMVFGKAGS